MSNCYVLGVVLGVQDVFENKIGKNFFIFGDYNLIEGEDKLKDNKLVNYIVYQ